MEIPADGFILQGTDIVTDESAMTGESDHINKDTLEKCVLKKQ